MNDQPITRTDEAEAPGTGALRRVLGAAAPPRSLIAIGVLISLVPIAATLAMPILVQELIAAMGSPSVSASDIITHPLAIGVAVLLAVGAIVDGFGQYVLSVAGLRMAKSLRLRMFADIIRRDVADFDGDESGGLVSRLTTDTQVITGLLTKQMSGLVSGVLMLIGSLVILLYLDTALTLAIFAIIAVAFIAMAPMLFAMSRITKAINDTTASFSAYATRIFGNITLVKAYTAEDAESDRMADKLDAIYRERRRASIVESALSPANGLTLTMAMLAILTYGGYRVAAGSLAIGTLTAFILYLFNIVGPLIQLSAFSMQLQASKGAASRIAPLLRDAPQARQPDTASRLPAWVVTGETTRLLPATAIEDNGVLVVDGVRFGYGPKDGEAALEIDRLEFAPGTQTVLTGESGCGKSTLFALLERFYAPWQGKIEYAGRDIADYDLIEWRSRIGYVPQSAPLLRGTIRDNVIYGSNGKVDDEAVLKALDSANCLPFVESLKKGLDTDVGESGSLISGGQKQRLAIARLFYRDPKILLLDEATANLDNENQTAVLAVLERLIADRITIMSTHRIESIGRHANVVSLSRKPIECGVTQSRQLAEMEA